MVVSSFCSDSLVGGANSASRRFDMFERTWSVSGLSAALVVGLVLPVTAWAQDSKPEFPPFDQVSKDFERVISTADDSKALYTLHLNKKKNEMLAELPANF